MAFLLEERSLNFSLVMHRLALAHLALPTSLTSGMTPALLLPGGGGGGGGGGLASAFLA